MAVVALLCHRVHCRRRLTASVEVIDDVVCAWRMFGDEVHDDLVSTRLCFSDVPLQCEFTVKPWVTTDLHLIVSRMRHFHALPPGTP